MRVFSEEHRRKLREAGLNRKRPEIAGRKQSKEWIQKRFKSREKTLKLRTHCKNGHEFIDENTYIDTDGCRNCKQCRRDYHKARRENRTEEGRNHDKDLKLKRVYGITLEEYNKMLERQENKCPICKRQSEEFKNIFHVDHCHTTGEVRQLLCFNCNSLLGASRESIDTLKEAIKYLEKHTIK